MSIRLVLDATLAPSVYLSRVLSTKESTIMRKLWHFTGYLVLLFHCVFRGLADIAFLSERDGERNIYVMNDHGGNIRGLTDTSFKKSRPDWSSDGAQIAFAADLNSGKKSTPQQYDIFIMNANGSRQWNLTEHPAVDVSPSWSPDGKSIAFTSFRNNGLDIYTIEIASRKVLRLTNNAFSSAPDWSPDGKSIVYQRTFLGRGRHIYVMNADGSHERQLLRRLRQPQLGNTTIFSFSPRWSPDSEYVLYIEGILEPDATRIANHVIVVDKHGQTPKVLNFPQKWKVDAVCWTDDGEAILFAAVPNGLTNDVDIFDIYKYRLRDGKITNISNHPSDNWGMDWTPNRRLSVSSAARLTTQWARIKAF